jgi:hypothetical protein
MIANYHTNKQRHLLNTMASSTIPEVVQVDESKSQTTTTDQVNETQILSVENLEKEVKADATEEESNVVVSKKENEALEPLPECKDEFKLQESDNPMAQMMMIMLQYQTFRSYPKYSDDENELLPPPPQSEEPTQQSEEKPPKKKRRSSVSAPAGGSNSAQTSTRRKRNTGTTNSDTKKATSAKRKRSKDTTDSNPKKRKVNDSSDEAMMMIDTESEQQQQQQQQQQQFQSQHHAQLTAILNPQRTCTPITPFKLDDIDPDLFMMSPMHPGKNLQQGSMFTSNNNNPDSIPFNFTTSIPNNNNTYEILSPEAMLEKQSAILVKLQQMLHTQKINMTRYATMYAQLQTGMPVGNDYCY